MDDRKRGSQRFDNRPTITLGKKSLIWVHSPLSTKDSDPRKRARTQTSITPKEEDPITPPKDRNGAQIVRTNQQHKESCAKTWVFQPHANQHRTPQGTGYDQYHKDGVRPVIEQNKHTAHRGIVGRTHPQGNKEQRPLRGHQKIGSDGRLARAQCLT